MKVTSIYIAISTLMFSLMEIVLKSAGEAFNPIQINLIRFLIGGLVLLPLATRSLHQANLRLRIGDIMIFSLTGFMCLVVSMTLYQLAIVYDQASTVAVVFSSNPVFALLFSYLILHEHLGRANLVSVIISLVGLIVIVNPAHLTNPLGLTLGILAAVSFGLYSIISRYGSVKKGYDGLVMTCFTFLVGTVELFVLIGLTHIKVIANFLERFGLTKFAKVPITKNVDWEHLPVLLFIGICVTGIGFALYFLAMERSNVSTASLVFFIKPALAPVLAMIILGEKISLTTVVGIIIIVCGSIVTFMGNMRREEAGKMMK